MRVKFWSRCYGCRHGGPTWHRGTRYRLGGHRFDWHYTIHIDGVRLHTAGPFKTFDRAMHSARRAWTKVEAAFDAACCGLAG